MKNTANVEFFAQTSFSRKKGQNENCFHQSLLSRGTPNIGKMWKKLFWDKKLHKSITIVIFNETKNFFDQNFSFYNWSKHKNFKVTYHWWEGLFFVLFYCHVRRCPKTGFRLFKKKIPVYLTVYPHPSSHHCQSGDIRAHVTPGIGHFLRISSSRNFLAFIRLQIVMGHTKKS